MTFPTKARFKGHIRPGFSLFYDLQINGYGPTTPMWLKTHLGETTHRYT